MKILNYLFAAVLAIAFSSCLSSNDKLITTTAFTSGQNGSFVEDLEKGTSRLIGTGGAYNLEINYTESTVNISVSGLQLIPGGSSYSFDIKDQKFTFDQTGSILVNIPNYIDTRTNVVINNFSMRFLDRQVVLGSSSVANPAWAISFEVNQRFKVNVVQYTTYYFGKSDVTIIATGEKSETTEAFYCLALDSQSVDTDKNMVTGRLYMYNAQFASNMPKMNMVIKDIPVKVTSEGLVFDSASLKLYVNENTEQPDYGVTDFYGVVDFDAKPDSENNMHNLDITFTCANRFLVRLDLGFIYKVGTSHI